MTERIVAAALQVDGMAISLPAPNRHHNVIHAMHKRGWMDESREEIAQGFVTSTGRFVEREEAFVIAKAAGQLLDRSNRTFGYLFSEDVW
jgi:hypothetical protein